MYTKEIHSINSHELGKIIGTIAVSTPELDKRIMGIELTRQQLDGALYQLAARIAVPYLLIVHIAGSEMEEDLQSKELSLAERIIPLITHTTQYTHFSSKVLLIRTSGQAEDLIRKWNAKLTIAFEKLGMGTMAIYYDNIPSRNTPGYFIELEESVSGAAYPLKWKINQLTDASAFINSFLEIPETPARSAEHQLLHLQEEGERLKSLNATLLKNIYDLNNYYRFVRGETTFKHHNREEPTETTNALPPGAGVEDYKKYYNQLYDRLPAWYKKIGTLLKIILLKRELWYYLSKKHKKIFLEVLYTLPSEKQLITWYYYEYEILPGWYKRIGKML